MIVGSETATIDPSITIRARPVASTASAFQRRGSVEGSAGGMDGVRGAEAADAVAPWREGRGFVMPTRL
ncbi:hypothetical protein GCM10009590_33510 [Brachybacterium alimentarium]